MKSCITIVTGLPRSGTSMMMRMLTAGGLDAVTDYIRQKDEDNPHGYYEFEKVKSIQDDTSWLRDMRGRVFKMVSMLLFHLPPDMDYKLIFMKRNLTEVIESQISMLKRSGKDAASSGAEEMELLYKKHLIEIENWLAAQPNIKVLYLDYLHVLDRPLESAHLINDFFGKRLSVNDMSAAVDKTLYRNRAIHHCEMQNTPACDTSRNEKEEIIKNLTLLGYM